MANWIKNQYEESSNINYQLHRIENSENAIVVNEEKTYTISNLI